MKAILVALTLTFFELFNVPVFWPILVMYFFLLFFLTMRRQIEVSGSLFLFLSCQLTKSTRLTREKQLTEENLAVSVGCRACSKYLLDESETDSEQLKGQQN